ncbi:MAG TPA: guanylate kinase [Phycisphaerales bacterium]|nr:guanylate kinase [Phycisphaerales bacterium]
MGKSGKLVVISGPSGAGKSTIVAEVLRRTGAAFSVSATTRKPRPGEQDGREYRFVDRAAFERMIDAGELLEWAEVFGQYYGTPAGPVREALAAGRTVVLDIDVQGGLQVHRAMPDATFVLIVPPSAETLSGRLRGRGTESPESIARRLAQARKEIETAQESGVYNDTIINDDLETAIRNVVRIVNRE